MFSQRLNVALITLALFIAGFIVGLLVGLAIARVPEDHAIAILAIAWIIVGTVYGSGVLIFLGALWLDYGLCAIVFNALGKADKDVAQTLLSLLGNVTIEGTVTTKDKKTTRRVVGVGMLGTLVIIGFAVAAIYVIFSIVPSGGISVGGREITRNLPHLLFEHTADHQVITPKPIFATARNRLDCPYCHHYNKDIFITGATDMPFTTSR